jgi:hypothetical protein
LWKVLRECRQADAFTRAECGCLVGCVAFRSCFSRERPEDRNRELWISIAGTYGMGPHDRRLLEDACAIADMITDMERAWIADGKPMTTYGSRAQLPNRNVSF